MAKNYSRVLVTGGAGFIGSNIVDRLISEGFEVTVLDNLYTGGLKNIHHHQKKREFHFLKGDIRDLDLIKEAVKDVDVVFHEAALVSPTDSLEKPILTNDVNVTGTLNLLKVSSDLDVKRFVFASSAAVYGDTHSPQKKEDATLNPTSPYGLSKSAAENYVGLFYKVYGLETVSLRYFNVYGRRQRFDINSSYGSVIAIFINRILKNMPLTIHGDGEQTRDFVYIQDIVDANMLALNSKNAVGEIFNVGTGTSVTVNQVAMILKRLLNKNDLKVLHTNSRPHDIRHGYADISKAKKTLNYSPRYSLERGLTEFLSWCTKNRDYFHEEKFKA